MKSKLLQRMAKGLLILVLLMLATTPVILAQEETPPNPYFSVETLTLPDGTSIDQVVINGPPTPPPGFEDERAVAPGAVAAAGTLPVPAYDWAYGCSATSAAMIAGYYDRAEYPNMYTGPTNGGVAPMDNDGWTTTVWNTDCPGPGSTTVRNNPLSATRNGVDGLGTNGHVDDYWIGYNCPGPDPWVGNWAEHTHGDCTGDYMNTNQWVYPTGSFNVDGSTVFFYYSDGTATPTSVLLAAGVPYSYDGAVGFQQFLESRGYTVVNAYNQYIQGYADPTNGITYDQYKAEIDAGRPVLVHVEGHTMAGVGYADPATIYVNDTWDDLSGVHTMTWGGSYSGMAHVGITVMQLAPIAYVSTQSGSWETSSTWVGSPPAPPGPNSDVTISSGDTVTLIGDSDAMTLTVESGAALDLAGYGLTVGGAVTNNGTMSQTLSAPNATTTEFLHIQNVGGSEDKYLGVDITPSSGSMGSTTVAVRGNQECTTDDPNDTVDRCFQITPSTGQTANVRFHYLDSELDAEIVTTMQAWRWGGSSWAAAGSTWTRNDGSPYNYCQANGVTSTQYGIMSLASGGPTAVTAAGSDANASQLIPVATGLLVLILIGGGLAIRHRRRGRVS